MIGVQHTSAGGEVNILIHYTQVQKLTVLLIPDHTLPITRRVIEAMKVYRLSKNNTVAIIALRLDIK